MLEEKVHIFVILSRLKNHILYLFRFVVVFYRNSDSILLCFDYLLFIHFHFRGSNKPDPSTVMLIP